MFGSVVFVLCEWTKRQIRHTYQYFKHLQRPSNNITPQNLNGQPSPRYLIGSLGYGYVTFACNCKFFGLAQFVTSHTWHHMTLHWHWFSIIFFKQLASTQRIRPNNFPDFRWRACRKLNVETWQQNVRRTVEHATRSLYYSVYISDADRPWAHLAVQRRRWHHRRLEWRCQRAVRRRDWAAGS